MHLNQAFPALPKLGRKENPDLTALSKKIIVTVKKILTFRDGSGKVILKCKSDYYWEHCVWKHENSFCHFEWQSTDYITKEVTQTLVLSFLVDQFW